MLIKNERNLPTEIPFSIVNHKSLLFDPACYTDPKKLPLCDLDHIEGKKTVYLPENEPNQDGVIGWSIQGILSDKVADAEQAFEHKLAEVTIADLYHECVGIE